jgi:predicted AAA+ superfamily ATPase
MIHREKFLYSIKEAFETFSVCGILGPRQCGKTTLAHDYVKQVKGSFYFFDLEDPVHLDQLKNLNSH